MKGILTRKSDVIWSVKWSDLHSFGHGTHWMFTELSPESNSIRYVKDNMIMYKPLEEGLHVEFELEHQINRKSFDEINHTPFSCAKLIFLEVDAFKKEQRNLDPHRPARCAMWLYNDQYRKQKGGSMDFWDKLSSSEKNNCRSMAEQISCTRPESNDERN